MIILVSSDTRKKKKEKEKRKVVTPEYRYSRRIPSEAWTYAYTRDAHADPIESEPAVVPVYR